MMHYRRVYQEWLPRRALLPQIQPLPDQLEPMSQPSVHEESKGEEAQEMSRKEAQRTLVEKTSALPEKSVELGCEASCTSRRTR